MHSDAPDHVMMRSLAQEIALGGDVVGWGDRMAVSPVLAREWTELPEFREVVQKCRLQHAERMVGRIARCVERAIERLVELSENSRDLGISLAATKAVIEKWVALSVYFVQEQEYASLQAQIKVLVAARAAEKKGVGTGWR